MNEEAKKESGIVGKAVKTAAVVGAGYGAHRGLRSDAAFNWASNNKDNMVGKGVLKYNEKMDQAKESILKNRASANGDPNIINADYTVSDAMPNRSNQKYNPNQITAGGQHQLPEASASTILAENEAKLNEMNKQDARAERMNEAKKRSQQQSQKVDTEMRQKQYDDLKARNAGPKQAGNNMSELVEQTMSNKDFIKQGQDLRDITGSTAMVDSSYSNMAGRMNYADDTQRAVLKHSRRAGSSSTGRMARGLKRTGSEAGEKAVQMIMKLT